MEKETKKKPVKQTKTIKKEVYKAPKEKKDDKDVLDVVYILDRSGSMSDVTEDTIKGYNSYIEGQLKNKVKLTTILFDDFYEVRTFRKDIKKVEKLTDKTYYTRGCTALYDAIGKTIADISKEKPNKVLFIINTDGLENASREYDKEKVRKLITSHKKWEFMYIGANIDSYAEASSIGIKRENTANYKKDKKGTAILYDTLGSATQIMCCKARVNKSWKKSLEDYLEENKED